MVNTCEKCHSTDLMPYIECYGGGSMHPRDEIDARMGYVMDAQSPRTYANWDELQYVVCLQVDLPKPQVIYVSKQGCCARWTEINWNLDAVGWTCRTCSEWMDA